MDLLQKELSFDSCAGEERIFAREIAPAGGKVRGVLQIAHGMAEHSQLYLPFAEWLAREGFAVAINDHLGHGRSVPKGGTFGYFGPGGAQNLVRDMRKFAFLMREEYHGAVAGYSILYAGTQHGVLPGAVLCRAVWGRTCGGCVHGHLRPPEKGRDGGRTPFGR